ncbi:MAG: hypothetical protein ACLU9S_01455 [Oscillospiraceae bacterium]
MIETIDLIEFEKIVLSRDEAKALKLLQSKNILLDDKSKNALNRLIRLGLAKNITQDGTMNHVLVFVYQTEEKTS